MDGDTIARLSYLLLLIAALGGWVIVEYRQRMGQALRAASAWGLIFVGVLAGYGLWNDIRRDVMPSQMVTSTGTVEIPRARDGHYYVSLTIDGTSVPFMVDTGASSMVLTRADARSLGIDPDGLMYLGQASTANGIVRTARLTLDKVVLGPFEDRDFAASVNDGEMEGSLLGMDYLGRFHIEITDGTMILSR
ncbi:MAG: TIGR02281 family clan AA aspartic protease [Paracoccaceae bacterium]